MQNYECRIMNTFYRRQSERSAFCVMLKWWETIFNYEL